MNNVIVLDDEPHWLRFFERLNERKASRFRFRTFETEDKALKLARRNDATTDISAALVDLNLSDNRTGLDFIKTAKESGVSIPFILCTQYTWSELDDIGIDANNIINSNSAYFVEKFKMEFGDNQNVDNIIDSAVQRHSETQQAIIDTYGTNITKVVANWRMQLSKVVGELDRFALKTASASDEAEGSGLDQAREALLALLGAMHIQGSMATLGRTVFGNSTPSAAAGVRRLTINRLAPAYNKLVEVTRLRELAHDASTTDESKNASTLLREFRTLFDGFSHEEVAVTVASAVDEISERGDTNTCLVLILSALDYFKHIRSVKHLVIFNVIASRLYKRDGDEFKSELFADRAVRLASRSGQLSLQIDATQIGIVR